MAIPPRKLTVLHEVYTPDVLEAIAVPKVDLGLKQFGVWSSTVGKTNFTTSY